MSVPERYWRFIGPEARARVSSLANVADEDWMQGWPLQVADPTRIGEFLDLLDVATDSDVAFALAELVLCSLDEVEESERSNHWDRLLRHILARPLEYAYLLIYWACVEEGEDGTWFLEPDPASYFPMSPRVREALVGVASDIGFSEISRRQ